MIKEKGILLRLRFALIYVRLIKRVKRYPHVMHNYNGVNGGKGKEKERKRKSEQAGLTALMSLWIPDISDTVKSDAAWIRNEYIRCNNSDIPGSLHVTSRVYYMCAPNAHRNVPHVSGAIAVGAVLKGFARELYERFKRRASNSIVRQLQIWIASCARVN